MAVQNTSLDEVLRKADDFFMGTGPVHTTMKELARRLSEAGIDYAVAGGMALLFYGYRRETIDVDFLLTSEGRDWMVKRLEELGYMPLFPAARKKFRDTETGIEIDIITTGEYPGDGRPKPVQFPEPAEASKTIDGMRILKLEKLVELKLASGMTAPHRLRDLADVQELIKANSLDSEFAQRLNPYVRGKYAELLEAVREGERLDNQE